MNKTISRLIILLAISVGLVSCDQNKDEVQSLNILFLMSDQHRGDFLGASGNDWIITPHLDSLASEGANFVRAYSSVPSCTPARTALLTGLSPWNHGMLGYMDVASQSYDYVMPALFTQHGYITYAIGKNHFGPSTSGSPPNTHGYQNVELEEAWYSVIEGGVKRDYQKWFEEVTPPEYDLNATGLGYTDHRGGNPFPYVDSLHATHWTAERALRFIDNSNDNGPWFLKVSFQRPHPPFDSPEHWLEEYDDKNIPMPKVGDWAKEKYQGMKIGSLQDTPNAPSGIYPDDEVRESRKAYAASLSFVDEQIGRIIKKLKETDQYENTLILYTSDHGDMMGDQYMWRKTRPYEPSARVPMIIRWPESLNLKAKRGQKYSELVALRDVFPTFADAANIEIPVKIDGESMLKIIEGTNDWRQLLGLEHSQIYEEDNAWIALTDGSYKYVYFTLTGKEQLFNLDADPFELHNIISEKEADSLCNYWYKKMVEYLKERGDEWVYENKLQIQERSILAGENFPHNN